MKRNWKTTTAGVCAIVVAIATALGAMFDGNDATTPEWGAVIAAVMAGAGLVAAADAKPGK